MEDFENMEWEAAPPAFDYSAEMKKIRKSLRKRNALIVCTCLILVAALTFGTIRFGIPMLEKQYWDPNTSTYLEGVSDLQLAMDAYTELLCPTYSIFPIEISKTGFATYDISVIFSKWTGNDTMLNTLEPQKSTVLSKGSLNFPAGFWNVDLGSPFNTFGAINENWNSSALRNLRKYPDYINVLAAVTFPEDLTTEDVYEFSDTPDYDVIWCVVRSGEKAFSTYPLCGYSLSFGLSNYGSAFGPDSEYPFLETDGPSENSETHFKSMLRYLQDQLENGTGFLPPYCDNENYYTDVLNYVEENGVNVYGAYITGSPQALLDLYNSGKINGISLCDAWINH